MILVTVFLMLSLGAVKAQVIGTPLNTVAVVNEDAKLACQYHPRSCLEIKWQKRLSPGVNTDISDGNTVYDSNKYRLDSSTVCELVIRKVQLTDSGTFVCTIAGSSQWSAELIVLQEQLSCNSNCETDSTAENDMVDFTCMLTGNGRGSAQITWWNKKTMVEIPNVPPQEQASGSMRRDFSMQAVASTVPSLICLTRVYVDQTAGGATNVPEVQCVTESCDILYSVRDVVTWPLGFASPGETITCKASGNPEPRFEWQWKENDEDDEWMDVPDETSETIEAFLYNGTSIKLRCVAKNSFRDIEYSAYSLALNVSKHGAAIRTAIICGVVFGVLILVIVAGVLFYKCRSSG